MKVVIIEDEVPAAARLKKMLGATSYDIEVVALLDTLAGAKAWISSNPAPDLIFMDIELSDGLSLDLVREVRVGCPVIFVTAYDEYWQEAFGYNGIDYLLKPVKQERLAAALGKYEELKEYFMTRFGRLAEYRVGGGGVKEKFLVKRGTWYRVNRKYLVNAGAIRRVNVLPKSKLLVEVEPAAKEDLVVSSENSAGFKKWLGR